jgi:hypothetical protein
VLGLGGPRFGPLLRAPSATLALGFALLALVDLPLALRR